MIELKIDNLVIEKCLVEGHGGEPLAELITAINILLYAVSGEQKSNYEGLRKILTECILSFEEVKERLVDAD